jgi:hypothetical protein
MSASFAKRRPAGPYLRQPERYALLSGQSLPNLTAVIVALTRAFPDCSEGGLRQLAASPTIYFTDEAHHGFEKIAHMTGIGRRVLRWVATRRDLKMDLGDLARRVAEDRRNGFAPFMVVGTVGTNGSRCDRSLPDLARFCRSEDCGFRSTQRGAAPPSSRRASGPISPESATQIRSPAMRINGSRCPWAPACSSAVILTLWARPFVRMPLSCRGKLGWSHLIDRQGHEDAFGFLDAQAAQRWTRPAVAQWRTPPIKMVKPGGEGRTSLPFRSP